jgi:hypothetical protein
MDGRRAADMKNRIPVQLSLPEPKMTAGQRRAWIRNRLAGYEYRQAARVSKRTEAVKRRAAAKNSPAPGDAPVDPAPEQLSISRDLYREIN